MNELEKLYHTLFEWKKEGKNAALATVVSIQGSAYRAPGARMLISDHGESAGMIGGGCFDADVREVGCRVIQTGTPELHLYDMAGADPWGLGMGCRGSVYMLVESLEHPTGLEWIREVGNSLQHRSSLLITHHFSRPMDYLSSDGNGEVQLQRTYRSADTKERVLPEDMSPYMFYEWLKSAPRLIIFGAGKDVIPVVEYASHSGFRVTVIDQREDLLHHGRFPLAAEFIHAWPEHYGNKIIPLPHDYVLMMSHRLENDAEAFRLYYTQQVSYLGFLGPRSRAERIFHEIVKVDSMGLESIREVIHSPIGLDLGAETAEEVAVSIAAELLAVRHRCSPQFLRDKQGAIHDSRLKATGDALRNSAASAGTSMRRVCGI